MSIPGTRVVSELGSGVQGSPFFGPQSLLSAAYRIGAVGLLVVNTVNGLLFMLRNQYDLMNATGPEQVTIPGALVQRDVGQFLIDEVRKDNRKAEPVGVYVSVKRCAGALCAGGIVFQGLTGPVAFCPKSIMFQSLYAGKWSTETDGSVCREVKMRNTWTSEPESMCLLFVVRKTCRCGSSAQIS